MIVRSPALCGLLLLPLAAMAEDAPAPPRHGAWTGKGPAGCVSYNLVYSF